MFDTTKAKLVWVHPYYPSYYFLPEALEEMVSWYTKEESSDDRTTTLTIWLGDDPKAKSAVIVHQSGPLKGLTTIKFEAMDAWFEEDEQIFIHPRDPYKRVDIVQSSREVRVEIGGVEVAKSKSPRLLFETGLPMRAYLPKTDCRLDLWQESNHTTGCPYKGEAKYYNVVLASGGVFENIAWWYPNTTAECVPIKGFVAFFDEKIDVWIDGVKQDRPVSKYS
ncbi:hypothetical protein CPB83DRAFT_844918, partial [Crepidotus variabilis]